MKLFDVYKHKNNGNIIQIESFAIHMNKYSTDKEMIVVFANIEKHNEYEIGSSPSSNGYGTQGEIEGEYDLLVPQEYLSQYSDWNEIFDLKEVDNKVILQARENSKIKSDEIFNEILKEVDIKLSDKNNR